MGLLTDGAPLAWESSKKHISRVKRDGVTQFLNIYARSASTTSSGLKWGDEVEYMLVRSNTSTRRSSLLLSAPQHLEALQRDEAASLLAAGSSVPVLWRPEYANWMIEGTPGIPYRCYAADLCVVEQNMSLRRAAIQTLLEADNEDAGSVVSALTLTAFPRVGCPDFTSPEASPGGPVARSLYIPDAAINPHPRFGTLTKNIRTRRGRKVDIRLPLFVDENTVTPLPLLPEGNREYMEDLADSSIADGVGAGGDSAFMPLAEAVGADSGREIVMDSAAFGMGCCCLQVTLQAKDMSESRYLYDQLAVMAPIMLSLTAATPAVRGLLADTDARWNIIAAAMDDRTVEESESGSVSKSRYSSIDCFISERAAANAASYNDLPVAVDDETYDTLRKGGVDHLLAQHVAHLYIRDPLVIYEDHIDLDNETSTDHFENIQSTNWNTVRFKPPPPGTEIGWRTEFRSMEVALTDFENAAFCVFTVLLSRVIIAFDLNLYIPMSAVDKNMATAHEKDSASERSFYFRKNILSSCSGSAFVCECGHIHHSSIVGSESRVADINKYCREGSGSDESDCDTFDMLTMAEIFNGKALCQDGRPAGFAFPGLVPLIRGYVESLDLDSQTKSRLGTYLDFVAERASGSLCTTAGFIRNFVRQHPDYKRDSVVSEPICHDLMEACRAITEGESGSAELLGRFHTERYGGVTSSETMMERMSRDMVGSEAGLLSGASLPKKALVQTLHKMATRPVATANCCDELAS